MKQIAAMLIAISPLTLGAHPCPFAWNITFANDTKIKGASLSDFVAKFNEAVKKETKGGITRAIIYDEKPDTFQRVPDDSPYAKEMDELCKRYVQVMEPLKKKGFGASSPLAIHFPAEFPVACILLASFDGGAETNYEETKQGARVTRRREKLECHSYAVSAKFLETVGEWKREDRIAAGVPPESYLFATFSEMTWAFDTFSEASQDYVRESFLDGVTLYLPEKKVILAIETKDKHEEMTKVMTERGFLSAPAQKGSPPQKQEAQQSSTAPPAPRPGATSEDNGKSHPAPEQPSDQPQISQSAEK